MTDITFNNLSKADGSALISHNNTIVQATVFGPVDVSQSKINYEEAIIEILYKPKVSIPTNSPAFDHVREVENLLKCIFKEIILTRLHPRTSISILVQEIYDGGFMLSSIINAVCCALIDAGIPMRCPISSISMVSNDSCKCNFVFDTKLDLVTVITKGSISEEDFEKAISEGKEEAKKNFDIIRGKVSERFTC